MLDDGELADLQERLFAHIDRRRRVRRVRHGITIGAALLLAAGVTTGAAMALYPVNSQGLTYGPADGRERNPTNPIEVVDPDLTLAQGNNGVTGYVLSTDLVPVFHSPEEVAAWLIEHPVAEDRLIPLYDKDMNVIGTFTIQGYDQDPSAPTTPGG